MNLDKLNPMQRKAAEQLTGPVLILAGAGSGKTRTLTYRVANLMAHGVPAWHILALLAHQRKTHGLARSIAFAAVFSGGISRSWDMLADLRSMMKMISSGLSKIC